MPPPSPLSLPPGTEFGAYEIRFHLGSGGMGEVYRAFDPRLGRDIALKVIRRVVVDDDSALDRLLREATLASALLRPYYLVLLAGAQLRAGRLDRAQASLDESTRVAEATGQHAYDAEHSRLQAEVHGAAGAADAAERKYREALEIPRRQGARWLELRAARGYAHHLVEHSRAVEARTLLEPIRSWFTEGRETMDFLYAEGLLKTLD